MKTCPTCSRSFQPRSTLQRHCSTGCAKADAKTRPAARGTGMRRTPVDAYKRAVRRLVASRDGDRCLICGRDRPLHLHRVRYGSQGGHYEVGNCVLVCRFHHDVVHSRKRFWQPLLLGYLDRCDGHYGEASLIWFRQTLSAALGTAERGVCRVCRRPTEGGDGPCGLCQTGWLQTGEATLTAAR